MATIEARSLASINALAANPPQYPVNPAEEKQDPLTLYISRVPGTRDVILSTSKPQLKNVTAHDVANSLYYLHLELPGEAPSEQLNQGRNSPRDSFESARSENRIPRKPLPTNAHVVTPNPSPPRAPDVAVTDFQGPPPPYQEHQPRQPQQSQAQSQAQPQQQHPLPPTLDASQRLQPQSHEQRPASSQQDTRRWTGDGRTWYSLEDRPDLPGSRPLSSSSNSRPPVPEHRVPVRPQSGPDQDTTPGLPFRPNRFDADQGPPLPPRTRGSAEPSPSPPRQQAPRPSSFHPRSRSRSPSPIKYHNTTSTPYTLHLIRRTPNSGHQWNVGRITSSQFEAALDDDYTYNSFDSAGLATRDSRRKTSAPQPEINVTIEASGYAKFRGMPSRQSVDAAKRNVAGTVAGPGSQASLSLPQRMAAAAAAATIDEGQGQGQGHGHGQGHGQGSNYYTQGFHRQVIMTYTKSWTSGLREKLSAAPSNKSENRPWSPSSPLSPPPKHGHGHTRQRSSVSALSADSAPSTPPDHNDGQASPNKILTQPGHGLRPKGYMFQSPWDGTCHFRTGNGGRSLKLRHVLPTPAAAAGAGSVPGEPSFNALSSASSEPGAASTAMDVSELRFNLPGRELFQKGKDEAAARRAELLGHFGKLVPREQQQHCRGSSGTDNGERGDGEDWRDDNDDPKSLGLHLGQEKAGGGNRGKRAKLGKLIITGEGMKMLDLVVAANMGVWWGAWERSF